MARLAIVCALVLLAILPGIGRAQDSAERRRHILAGNQSYRQGDYSKAAREYELALEQGPDAVILFNLGNARFRLGELDRAALAYRKSIRLDSSRVEAHINLARVLLEAGDIPRSIEVLSGVLRDHPASKDACRTLALAHEAGGSLTAAASAYRRALGLEPESSRLHAALGLVLQRLERWDEAVPAYREALRISPGDPELYASLGRCLHRAGRQGEAIDALEAAVRLGSRRADLHRVLGDLYYDRRWFREAADAYARTAQSERAPLEISFRLASARYLAGDGAAAVRILEAVMDEHRTSEDGWMLLAGIHLSLKSHDSANQCYRRAGDAGADRADVLLGLGQVAFDRGHLGASEGHLRKSLQARPDSAAAARLLAEILRRSDRPAEARALLDTVGP